MRTAGTTGQIRAVRAAMALLLAAVCLPASAAGVLVGPPASAVMDRIRNHEAALVLFQFSAVVDGKQTAGIRGGDSNRQLRFYIARLDDLDAPKQVTPAAPSEAAGNDGWRYLVLSPGTYYLLVLPPGVEQNPPAVAYDAGSGRYGRLTHYEFKPGRGGFFSPELGVFVFRKSRPADFQELQGFWFQVPGDVQLVYLGSAAVTCKGGRGLFGSLIDNCSDYEFTLDEQAGRDAATSLLPGFDVAPRALVPYGKPRAGVSVPQVSALALTSRASSELATAFTGAELTPSPAIFGTDKVFALFNLLSTSGRVLGRAAEERRAEQRAADIQPCIDRLAETVAGAPLAAKFASVLAAGSSPGVAGQDASHRLVVSLPILRLRQSGQPQDLALELGMEVRLEDVASGRLDYYSLLLYGPDLPNQNPHARLSPLYTRIVPERAPTHLTAEWCGDGGPALLEGEIAAGLKHLATQVAQDLETPRR
jgi:hypothetical protein